MGYRIIYRVSGDVEHVRLWSKWLKYVGILALSVMFIITMVWISGSDRTITVNAMEDMADMLQQGEPFTDAFAAFCINILQGAQCG